MVSVWQRDTQEAVESQQGTRPSLGEHAASQRWPHAEFSHRAKGGPRGGHAGPQGSVCRHLRAA